MTTVSELGPQEREAELARLRKQMRKAGRGGDRAEYDRLSALYGRLKGEHVEAVHEERIARVRAERAAVRARERAEPSRAWRLPAGFSSPLAARRAREGRRGVVVPDSRRPALSPWRRGSLMETRIWWP